MISAPKITTQIAGAGLIAVSTMWVSEIYFSAGTRGLATPNMVVGYFLVGALSLAFNVVVGGRTKIVRSQFGVMVVSLMVMVMGWMVVSSVFDKKPEGKFSCEGMGEMHNTIVF